MARARVWENSSPSLPHPSPATATTPAHPYLSHIISIIPLRLPPLTRLLPPGPDAEQPPLGTAEINTLSDRGDVGCTPGDVVYEQGGGRPQEGPLLPKGEGGGGVMGNQGYTEGGEGQGAIDKGRSKSERGNGPG
ncbi:probable H/ACA ribonucleoprotein complex subunit 1 [Ischnura elegans]|uniref:probable H/ACA ribonucleoprotein complex subunit 1 n=1 Tax=Ischnura elegans TaxID=197161 RepID=UPI001ED88B1F|nr:probable H/ACA ribonucleoprotein complex subunit 1 [Ischnura elegans]